MARAFMQVIAAVCFMTLTLVAHAAAPSDSETQAQLRRICQEMLDAVAPGHADVWRKYLHDRVVLVDEYGKVRTKEELLKEFSPLPAGLVGSIAIDRFKAEIHGDVAILAYEMQEHLDYHGQILHSRFRSSDTWIKTAEGWRLIGQQAAAVLKDPPAIKLSQPKLCAYNGSYTLTDKISITVACTADGLRMERAGRPAEVYLPEVLDVFFAPGQPRTRRIFERSAEGKVVAFVDRREGEDIRWTRKP